MYIHVCSFVIICVCFCIYLCGKPFVIFASKQDAFLHFLRLCLPRGWCKQPGCELFSPQKQHHFSPSPQACGVACFLCFGLWHSFNLKQFRALNTDRLKVPTTMPVISGHWDLCSLAAQLEFQLPSFRRKNICEVRFHRALAQAMLQHNHRHVSKVITLPVFRFGLCTIKLISAFVRAFVSQRLLE